MNRFCLAVLFCSWCFSAAAALLQPEGPPVLRPYGRLEVHAQLNGLYFQSVAFNRTPLPQVIKVLTADAQNAKYRHNGLNLLAEGLSAVEVTVDPPLQNVSLRFALDAIARGASEPLAYRVEPHGVVFTRFQQAPPPLYTRWFKLKPDALQQRFPDLKQLDGDKHPEIFRRLLPSSGINFRQPRQIVFNTALSQLRVRATLDELDQIETALKEFQLAAQTLHFELYFAEVPAPPSPSLLPNLSFDAALGNELPAKQFKLSTSAVNGLFTYEQARTGGFITNRSRATNFTAVTGTLSGDQFETVLKAFQQKTGVDLLKFPKKVGRDTYPTLFQMNSPPVGQRETGRHLDDVSAPLGPSTIVIPNLAEDQHSLHLEVTSAVKEFIGYNFDQSDAIGLPDPLAIYRVRQLSGEFELPLGHTAVLGIGPVPHTQRTSSKVPVLGDLPIAGKLFRNETKTTVQKNLWFFITPTLVGTNLTESFAE